MRNVKLSIFSWLFAASCLQSAFAAESTKQLIQAAYQKAALAAEYKYVDGMLCNRADEFQLLTAQGMLVDLTAERQRFLRFLEPASRVHLETKILGFDSEPKGTAVLCAVYQVMQTQTFDPATGTNKILALKTYSRDYWLRKNGQWQLVRSAVVQQTTGPGEALPATKPDPALFRKPKG